MLKAVVDAPASWPVFVCPRCRGDLHATPEAYSCAACTATYPIVLGIPDFRVEPDPWIDLDEDRVKARRVIAMTEGAGLAASVEAYWSMTPGTPKEFARRFIDYVLSGERRAAEWLDTMPAQAETARGPWLEIGCASGDLLAVAAQRGIPVTGVDVAMRWLVLARRRPALQGAAHRLVCANGEFLPFRDREFARIVSIGTLEHCRRVDRVIAEAARVLRPGGRAWLRTTNRYSLLREPHVNVWGVGLVPRRWADAYVRWSNGQRYLHHRPLSRRELRRDLRRAGFRDVKVQPASLLANDRARFGAAARIMAPVYEWAARTPGLRVALSVIAPQLESGGAV
jgi:SAM-dependent methyltransferase